MISAPTSRSCWRRVIFRSAPQSAAADLRTVRRPSTTVTPDALHDPGAAVGRVVAVALLRDDVVGARHLVPGSGLAADGSAINGVVPVGRRAVHVVVKDGFQPPPRVGRRRARHLRPVARHDRRAAGPRRGRCERRPRCSRSTARARPTPVRLTARDSDNASATDTSGSGITLLVTEAEARAVAYAASLGEISLALAPAQSACCPAPAS